MKKSKNTVKRAKNSKEKKGGNAVQAAKNFITAVARDVAEKNMSVGDALKKELGF